MRHALLPLCALSAFLGAMAQAHAQELPANPAAPVTSAASDLALNQGQPLVYDREPLPSQWVDDDQWYGEVEYLLWWMKPVCQKVPLLNGGIPTDAHPGAEGQPGTQSILGVSKYEMPAASGTRATLGGWLSGYPDLGVEASGFWLGQVENTHAYHSTPGGPATYVPYIDQNNVASALPFSIPGVVDGSVVAVGSSRLWGAEANMLWKFLDQPGDSARRVSLIGGVRHVSLRDEIAIVQTQTLVADPALFATGTSNYVTRNNFYGPQLGARFTMERGRWGFDVTGKFAPGEMHLVSDISGSPLAGGNPVIPGSVPGPLLSFPSNVGQRETWALAFAQEINMKLRYQVAQNVLFTLGYNFLYLSRIACPGDQEPANVNVTQLAPYAPLTGRLAPAPGLFHTDYFAQGLSLGLEYRF